jgi:uncharacterized lipoprotein YddW (UPF0748 family)
VIRKRDGLGARTYLCAVVAAAVAALVPAIGLSQVRPSGPPLAVSCPATDSTCVPPPVMREFRGVWVASVRNLDWPSKPGLPPSLAKAELIALLDRAAALGLNAVLLQVRPAGDALYESKIEPWSEYLTGKQGLAPAPLWDPLEFAVREAHARGLELHAWFNPYRAKEPSAKGPLASSHIARRHPELVKKYGTQLWMDPGEPAVREEMLRVVLDVVKRYDIDGVHLDDYFYPYPERRRRGGSTDFPDDRSWKAYRKRGGTLARDDWRRSNVDELVETLHKAITKEKPWVKFGISPFQLWRPGNPPSITTGLDAYATLYADSRKWFTNGWVDYLSPQLYRRVDEERSYGVLLDWWASQNSQNRHLWPGLYTSGVRTGDATEWRSGELVAQVRATRAHGGVTGNVHFSMEAFLTNRDSIGTVLQRDVYAEPALVPASPWMTSGLPPAPEIDLTRPAGGYTLTIVPGSAAPVRWWLVQIRLDDGWKTHIVDGAERSIPLARWMPASMTAPSRIAVTAVDRAENASPPAVLRVR